MASPSRREGDRRRPCPRAFELGVGGAAAALDQGHVVTSSGELERDDDARRSGPDDRHLGLDRHRVRQPDRPSALRSEAAECLRSAIVVRTSLHRRHHRGEVVGVGGGEEDAAASVAIERLAQQLGRHRAGSPHRSRARHSSDGARLDRRPGGDPRQGVGEDAEGDRWWVGRRGGGGREQILAPLDLAAGPRGCQVPRRTLVARYPPGQRLALQTQRLQLGAERRHVIHRARRVMTKKKST